jgi:hypothetical protein
MHGSKIMCADWILHVCACVCACICVPCFFFFTIHNCSQMKSSTYTYIHTYAKIKKNHAHQDGWENLWKKLNNAMLLCVWVCVYVCIYVYICMYKYVYITSASNLPCASLKYIVHLHQTQRMKIQWTEVCSRTDKKLAIQDAAFAAGFEFPKQTSRSTVHASSGKKKIVATGTCLKCRTHGNNNQQRNAVHEIN